MQRTRISRLAYIFNGSWRDSFKCYLINCFLHASSLHPLRSRQYAQWRRPDGTGVTKYRFSVAQIFTYSLRGRIKNRAGSLDTHARSREISRLIVTSAFAAMLTLTHAEAVHASLSDLVFQLSQRGNVTSINTVVDDNGRKSSMKIRIAGSITFTDSEDDVLTLTRRAQFIESIDGNTRRLDFRRDSDGKVVRTYRVNGQIVAYDADAQKWFAAWVPSLLRETGLNADQRIARFNQKGGKAAVLAEMDRIKSDYARAHYVGAYVKAGLLDDAHMPRVIGLATKTNSDFERRKILNAIVEKQSLSSAQQVMVMGAVAKMESSFEQKNVLVALAPQLAADQVVSNALRETIREMDSDFERKTVIEALAARGTLAPTLIEASVESLDVMTSDFERANALKALVAHLKKPTNTQLAAIAQSMRNMRSDFELRGVLTAWADAAAPERSTFQAMLQTVKDMRSDFEKRIALEAIARKMPRTPELIASYRDVTKGMGDFERGLAERAL